jgi:hypothetical protein
MVTNLVHPMEKCLATMMVHLMEANLACLKAFETEMGMVMAWQ